MVLAADPDTRAVGITDQAEHVLGLGSRFVRPRHGLQRDGAHAEDEIVTAAGHLPRNGVRRGDVVFRAKAAQLHAVSVGVAARGQGFDRTVGSILQRPHGGVPHQRHPDRTSRIPPRFARSDVGVEKNRGSQEDQNQSEGESLENFEHGSGCSPSFKGPKMFCRHKSRQAASTCGSYLPKGETRDIGTRFQTCGGCATPGRRQCRLRPRATKASARH